MARGIRERHARSCRMRAGGRCSCEPSYEAQLWNHSEAKPVRKTFSDQAEARTWLRDAHVAVRRGRQLPGRCVATFGQVADEWMRLARAGVIRSDGGDEFKPGTLRTYDQHLRLRVLDHYGSQPIAELDQPD